jgi:ribonuclease J
MNIITNKDVFSDENQAKIPKKIERGRGRPRKASNPNEGVTAASDMQPEAQPQSQEQPVQQAPEPTHQDQSGEPVSGSQEKPVFYQASKPQGGDQRQPRFPRQAPPRPSATTPAINPASLVPGAQGFADRPRSAFNATPRSQNGQPPTPGRFATPPRRPGRNQFPQDGAGHFMQSATAQQTDGMTPIARDATSTQKLKIIPLGGLEEIGKNMTVLEYGNDILIIDMGFMFPDVEMFGVDYIIPDVSYLEDKKDRIRGAVITHGHLDHTGAIPYLMEKLGFPTLYGTPITIGMCKQRLEEFGLLGRNKLVTIEPGKDVLQLGSFRVNPFHLIHSIPGAVGLEIETPNGRIAYCTDWKFDYSPADGNKIDFQTLAAIGGRGVDLLFSDSTNAERPGHSISEKVVEQALAASVGEAQGRVIVAMFATNLSRIQQTLNVAARNNRKVLLLGRSMQNNVEMAIGLKAINVPANTIISEREVGRFNDSQILILSTGAQGEDRSALVRMASGEHRIIKIKKGDTVIISASPIPGNERSVNGVMDVLYKAGAQVIYNKVLDVHTSGHAYQEDLKLMIALMRPKYFIPLHGERSKLILHGKLAQEVGVSPENIIIGDNGLVLEMDNSGKVIPTDNHVPAGYVMVDGLGVGDVGNIVLRDRQAMAREGVFVLISVYDTKNHKFLTSPDIISRGFIYMRENEQFVNDVRNEIKKFLASASDGNKAIDLSAVKNELRDMVGKMLYDKTERQPMVIPVIIEI